MPPSIVNFSQDIAEKPRTYFIHTVNKYLEILLVSILYLVLMEGRVLMKKNLGLGFLGGSGAALLVSLIITNGKAMDTVLNWLSAIGTVAAAWVAIYVAVIDNREKIDIVLDQSGYLYYTVFNKTKLDIKLKELALRYRVNGGDDNYISLFRYNKRENTISIQETMFNNKQSLIYSKSQTFILDDDKSSFQIEKRRFLDSRDNYEDFIPIEALINYSKEFNEDNNYCLDLEFIVKTEAGNEFLEKDKIESFYMVKERYIYDFDMVLNFPNPNYKYRKIEFEIKELNGYNVAGVDSSFLDSIIGNDFGILNAGGEIKQNERGFYTNIFVYFSGNTLDADIELFQTILNKTYKESLIDGPTKMEEIY